MIENSFDRIFLSDTHLSTKGCNYKDLLRFLTDYYAPTIYFVGDIIDLWKLKTIEKWPDEHTEIVSQIVQILQDKIEIRYIVGNHDEFFENIIGQFSNLIVKDKDVVKINGKKLWVRHGHEYDLAIRYFKWIGIIGTGIHDLFRKRAESIFSLSEYLKEYPAKITKFEKYILEDVKKKGLDGVICGHTHEPNLVVRDGLIYANTGDWVSNSSFIVQKDNELILMAYEKDKVVVVKKLTV